MAIGRTLTLFRSSRGKFETFIGDWGRPVLSLLTRVFVSLVTLAVVLFLPLHAFFSQGPTIATAASEFAGALWHVSREHMLLAAGGFAAVVISSQNIFRRYFSRRRLKDIIDIHNEYMKFFEHKFENDIMRHLRNPPPGGLSEERIALISEASKELLVKMCSRLSDAFGKITAAQCCATIKIIDRSMIVSTIARNFGQYEDRTRIDSELPSYSYNDNTAFEEIIDNSYDCYKSNWLPIRRLFRIYYNRNPNWLRFYSATAVVPIKLRKTPPAGEPSVIGFICVDNNSGWFPRGITKSILTSYSRAAHDLLQVLGQIRTQ